LVGVVESNDYLPAPVEVTITLSKINAALGTHLKASEVEAIFRDLGFGLRDYSAPELAEKEDIVFNVAIPPRRWDIHIPADLVEEVARLYGYDRLPLHLPVGNEAGALTARQRLRKTVRSRAEAQGLSEVYSYSITTPQKAVDFVSPDYPTTSLLMPMTEDHQTLRANIIPGLLDIIAYNQNRKQHDLAIYEIGTVFAPNSDSDKDNKVKDKIRPTEIPNFAMAISGNIQARSYDHPARKVDFYDIKGIVEALLNNDSDLQILPLHDNPQLHPGRAAQILIGDEVLGFLGQVHPAVATRYNIDETYVASLDLAKWLALSKKTIVYQDIPRVPAVARDIAFMLDSDTPQAEVVKVIKNSGVKTLSQVELFDLYQGGHLLVGKKSLAYSLTFQAKDQSMTEEDINRAMEKISKNLVEKLHAEIR
jgi:phenylalanyl-tRNA synthetase beta chain